MAAADECVRSAISAFLTRSSDRSGRAPNLRAGPHLKAGVHSTASQSLGSKAAPLILIPHTTVNTSALGASDEAINQVVDKDPIDQARTAGQPGRLATKKRRNYVGNQLHMVRLTGAMTVKIFAMTTEL